MFDSEPELELASELYSDSHSGLVLRLGLELLLGFRFQLRLLLRFGLRLSTPDINTKSGLINIRKHSKTYAKREDRQSLV